MAFSITLRERESINMKFQKEKELIEEFGVGSDPVLEKESRIMDKKRDIEAAKKEH